MRISWFKGWTGVFLTLLMLIAMDGHSQRVSISGDAIKWATLSPNIGVEVVLSQRVSVDVEASCNMFNNFFSEDLSIRHMSISPEVRYWLKRPFYSHYLGVNMLMSSYDLRLKDKYRDGMVAAIGLGYGYSLMLNDRWNLIPSIGIGLGYVSYLKNETVSDVNPKSSGLKIVPTRFGLSFNYLIN